MPTEVSFQTASGQAASGFLELPSASKAPAVVLIQEWWGINAHIQSILGRLAAEGFLALAPDLYHGAIAKDAAEAGKKMGELDWPLALDEIAGAVAWARGHERATGKVAVMGFCMGGALSFATATRVAGLDAVVPFYGIPDPKVADYTKVTAPILAHFASKDGWAKPEAARAIQKQLEGIGRSMRLEVYEADHAFFNDARPEVYDAENAKLAWSRTLEFLRANLG